MTHSIGCPLPRSMASEKEAISSARRSCGAGMARLYARPCHLIIKDSVSHNATPIVQLFLGTLNTVLESIPLQTAIEKKCACYNPLHASQNDKKTNRTHHRTC